MYLLLNWTVFQRLGVIIIRLSPNFNRISHKMSGILFRRRRRTKRTVQKNEPAESLFGFMINLFGLLCSFLFITLCVSIKFAVLLPNVHLLHLKS